MKFCSIHSFLTGLVIVTFSIKMTAQKHYQILEGESFRSDSNFIISKLTGYSGKQREDFWNVENIKIGSEYQLIDSLKIDSINNLHKRLILILSPGIQETDKYKLPCYKTPANKRLMVILSEGENGYTIENVNENLILNKAEYPSEPFRKIIKTKIGFKIQFNIGSSKKCNYEFLFSTHGHTYFLRQRNRECYLINLSKQEREKKLYKYSFSNSVKKINIRNFIDFPKW